VRVVVLLVYLLSCHSLRAELLIEVTDWVDDPSKIAVVPFYRAEGDEGGEDLAAIVAADLRRSGQFEVLPAAAMYSFPHTAENVHFRDWRALGVEYLLIGRRQRQGERVAIQFELFDVYRQRLILSGREQASFAAQRPLAHRVSDAVYAELTGVDGDFSSRILYVSVKSTAAGAQQYRLIVADADGARPRHVLTSSEPILSPTWSRDGQQVAYVSFESSRPAIYRQVLASGEREQLTAYPGLNSAPAFSPDGKQLAMVLSKDGDPEIYLMDLASRALRRLTHHYAIDTEPSWAPDGKSLLFTSDRGGQPQIYRIDLDSGKLRRLTFSGSYNARASVLPDGKSMVMMHRDISGYHIAWQEFSSSRLRVLTDSSLDESPSISANGRTVLYATKHRGRGVLAAVSIDGGAAFRLPSPSSDVREPVWSPPR